MPFFFLIPPIVKRVRKRIALKKGEEYKPLFPKIKERVDNVKLKIKNNGKDV
tara:strand:- start:846 stop:1001 length:156 start_codon:yes stop_codon:yes gene_type:complete